MQTLGLSNLELRSNLLRSTHYQQEMSGVTAFELKDAWRRNPNLADLILPTTEQTKELRNSLFWGEKRVTIAEDDRARAWLESLAEKVEPAIESLEGNPKLEDGFELLVVTGQLCRETLNSIYREKAIAWHHRVRSVLARDEFQFTSDMIDQKLSQLIDLPIESEPVHSLDRRKQHDIQATATDFPGNAGTSFPAVIESTAIEGVGMVGSQENGNSPIEWSDSTDDPRLQRIVDGWTNLPDPFKISILAILDGVEQLSQK